MRSVPTGLLLLPALVVAAGFGGVALVLGLARTIGLQPFAASAPSLQPWLRAAAVPGLWPAVAATLAIAAAATVLAVAMGLAAALALRGLTAGPGRTRLAGLLVQLNLAVPHVVVAAGTLFLLSQAGLIARIAHALGLVAAPADFPALTQDPLAVGVVLAYAVKEAPFVAAVVLVECAVIGEAPVAAARGLGASPGAALRLVLLPMIAPGLAVAAGIVFAYTLGAYEVPALLGAYRPATLPVLAVELFTSDDLADRPAAIAISVATAAVALAVIAGLRRLVIAPVRAS